MINHDDKHDDKPSMEIDGHLPLNSDKPTRRGRVSPCKCHGCSPSPAPPVVQKNDLWIHSLLSDWSKISGKMTTLGRPIGLKRLLHGTPFFSPMSLWTFQNHNVDSSGLGDSNGHQIIRTIFSMDVCEIFAQNANQIPPKTHTLGI